MLQRMRRFRELFIPGVFGLLVVITLVCVLAGCGSGSGATAVAASTRSGTTGAPPSTQAGHGIPTISVLHPSHDLPAARTAARDQGWRVVELDTSHGTDKPYFLEVCRRSFDLPDWFGRNWDALADSLTDVDDAPGTLVLWRGAGTLDAGVRETAAEIFAGRAARAGDGFAAFLVLVGDTRRDGRSMNDL